MIENRRRKTRKKPNISKREEERIKKAKEKENKTASVWFVRIMFTLVLLTMLMGLMVSILQSN